MRPLSTILEEIGLVLFLFLVDGRIVIDHDIEGVAGLGLHRDERLFVCLVIEQIAGISVAFTFNRLAHTVQALRVLRFPVLPRAGLSP